LRTQLAAQTQTHRHTDTQTHNFNERKSEFKKVETTMFCDITIKARYPEATRRLNSKEWMILLILSSRIMKTPIQLPLRHLVNG
jgi:hypothetical protein